MREDVMMKIRQLHQHYPFEMLLIWGCSLFSLFFGLDNYAWLDNLILLYPLFFATLFLSQFFKYGRPIALCYCIGLGIVFHVYFVSWQHEAVYLALLLIHFLLFIAYPFPQDNKTFVMIVLARLVQLVFSLVFAIVISVALALIYFSLTALFGLGEMESFFKQIILFSLLFFTPFSFLFFEASKQATESLQLRYEVEVMINYVFSPVVMIYTLIVYVYLGKILWDFSLPEGGLAYIIIAYLTLGLVCIALQTLLKGEKWERFYRYFTLLSLIPLALLWVGIYTRISEYGLTYSRVVLCVVAGLLSVFLLFSFSKTLRQYRVFTFISVAVLFFVFIVGSPKTWIAKNQFARFEQLLARVNLLDENQKVSQKLYEKNIAKKLTTEEVKYFRLIDDIMTPYIRYHPEAIAKYGEEALDYLTGFYHNQVVYHDHHNNDGVDIHFYASRNMKRADPQGIDLQGYRKLYVINGYAAAKPASAQPVTAEDEARFFQRQFALTDLDSGYQYTFDERYFVEVFAQAGLDIHKKYREEELAPLVDKLTRVPTQEGGILYFRDMDFQYERQGDRQGYVYQGGYIEFYLAP